MMKITAIAYTGYPVTDMSRARGFYEGLLGLQVATVFDHEGKQWIEYDIGAGTLGISNMSADKWKPSPDGPALAFEVADFAAAMTVLRAGGVKFIIEPMDTGVCEMAIVADPDGNSLIFHRRKA
ncbi:Glyoxalase-like domain protein [Lacunisphaera limnophila]|uniref:Glyoxalase-like domain protein n=1 Tax=Lacunisphaera limnophila TaxID=1838286 RepID=A0A1D8AR57_9BACT|nr:VOC family protein [Lacunisphaera limnophila]AOS43359.1 Glyoxalase-like domain protein [Lacunisphaera limnophila]